MRRGLVILGVVGSLGAVQPARAEGGIGRRGQLGGAATFGTGYRALFPYHDEFCGQSGQKVCTGRSPIFADVGLSYGLTDAIQLLVELRLGLESDFAAVASGRERPKALALAPGARFIFDDEGAAKLFSTVQAVVDLTDFSTVGGAKGTDLGAHNVNGVVFDVGRHLSLTAQVGETLGFVRWLRFELEVGLGVEGRFP